MKNELVGDFLIYLNMLHNTAFIEGAKKTQSVARDVDKFLRYSYYRKNQIVSLIEEMDSINILINIFKARFGSKLEYKECISPEIEGVYLPHYSLLGFVENSIYHGLEPSENEWELEISISKTHDNLHVVLSDNGVGFDSNVCESPVNLNYGSVLDIKKRMNQYYNAKEKVEIKSNPGRGTKVKMILPIT